MAAKITIVLMLNLKRRCFYLSCVRPQGRSGVLGTVHKIRAPSASAGVLQPTRSSRLVGPGPLHSELLGSREFARAEARGSGLSRIRVPARRGTLRLGRGDHVSQLPDVPAAVDLEDGTGGEGEVSASDGPDGQGHLFRLSPAIDRCHSRRQLLVVVIPNGRG